MSELTDKGFVFLDAGERPYWVRMWGSVPWVFRWHADRHWVSMRQVTQQEVWQMEKTAIPEAWAEVYHQQHGEHEQVATP